ncbi:MAG TPA: hypothetical protein VJ773_06675, partial [Gemmatimonadales bacterium]|nr:hypothetical protein [Gemmatimonadales bacterium]
AEPPSRRATEPQSSQAAEPIPITALLAEAADLAGSLTTLARLRSAAPAPEPAVWDVRDLVYRGRRALDRALELRTALADRMVGGEPVEGWRPILDELVDLLPLAAEDA